jgi:hypothetical protein
LTKGTGRSEGDLPVFDALEPADAGNLAGGQPGDRRRLGPAHGVAIAAAVLVVLIGGIVLGNRPADRAPSVAPTGPAAAARAGAATATPSVEPTPDTSPCQPPPGGQYPTLALAVRGSPATVDAKFGYGYRPGSETEVPGFRPPNIADALIVRPFERLVVSAAAGVCLGSLAIDYVGTGEPLDTEPVHLRDGAFEVPVHAVTLNGLPTGDWILRANARFETPEDVRGGELVTISFFRVVSGDFPAVTDAPPVGPSGTPAATPTVPCGSGQPAPDLAVVAIAGGRSSVPGAVDLVPVPPDVPTEVPVVDVPVGDPVLIVTGGELCAVSWDIRLLDPVTGDGGTAYQQANPNDDPLYAAQNRWQIVIQGDQILVARIHFAGGPDIVRAWRLVSKPFAVPAAFLVGLDGARFEATPGCGLSLALANGYAAADACSSIGYAPGPEALTVTAFSPIGFEIPGWDLQSWSAECGIVAGGANETFEAPTGCGLGGGASAGGLSLRDPVLFLLPPGDTVVQIAVIATAPNGDRYSDIYYAHVVAR